MTYSFTWERTVELEKATRYWKGLDLEMRVERWKKIEGLRNPGTYYAKTDETSILGGAKVDVQTDSEVARICLYLTATTNDKLSEMTASVVKAINRCEEDFSRFPKHIRYTASLAGFSRH